jgi:hypothetical protein
MSLQGYGQRTGFKEKCELCFFGKTGRIRLDERECGIEMQKGVRCGTFLGRPGSGKAVSGNGFFESTGFFKMKGEIFGRSFLDLHGEAISDSMVEVSSCGSGEGGKDGLSQERMMKREGRRIDRLVVEEA